MAPTASFGGPRRGGGGGSGGGGDARRRDFDLGGGAFSPARSASRVPIPGAATRRDATPSASSSSAPPPSRAPEARAMWELDSVAPLPASAPPPKAEGEKPKRSYLSRAYKGLRRAAGFKSKKTALALLPAASETAERPRPEGSAAAAAAASAAASPVNANPFASLRTVSYTHLRAHRDGLLSRMPSSA